MINFIIPIEPVAKARPRFSRSRAYTPKETVQAEKAIGLVARQNIKSPIADPVALNVVFGMKIPKSWNKKKQREMQGQGHVSRPDVDNLLKTVLDGLNGIAFIDDSQVYRIVTQKIYADIPFIEVSLNV